MISRATVGAFALALATSSYVSAQPAPPGVPVSVVVAKRQDVPIFVRGIGTVLAFQSVLVRARVDGTLDKVVFKEGQDVKQGDLLASIDPRPYQAVLDQAVAKKAADIAMLSNAKRDLVRYSDLAKSEFASRQSVDTQQASVSQTTATTQADDAAIAAAKLNLDFTRIISPIDGRTGLRLVDAGNLIHATDANGLVTINQIHPIAVYFTLPQDMFPTVQDAMHASGATPLPTSAFGGDDKRQLGDGTLVTMDNAIDTSTGTIKLKATFPNTDDRLWPGQFVNVHLQLSTTMNAVTVPSAAVQHGVNGLYVYAVQNNTVAKLVPIEVGQDNGTITIVTKGLSGGETVVTGGQSRLTDGTKVAVALATASAADAGASSPSSAKTGG
jgi:multidrug efflux system membrane fusion protein